jgi:hypothetical protein
LWCHSTSVSTTYIDMSGRYRNRTTPSLCATMIRAKIKNSSQNRGKNDERPTDTRPRDVCPAYVVLPKSVMLQCLHRPSCDPSPNLAWPLFHTYILLCLYQTFPIATTTKYTNNSNIHTVPWIKTAPITESPPSLPSPQPSRGNVAQASRGTRPVASQR